MNEIREEVRGHYADAALTASSGGCCADGCCGEGSVSEDMPTSLYPVEELGAIPDAAVQASLGCGNPIAVAELRPGETVLDLGSGGGIDVLLSARRVGPTGRAFGLDMTDEMLELARGTAKEAGVENVEFLKGYIEDIPMPDESVDVVISNCVISLSVDKPRVFAEIARVLRPGGRVGVTDIVAGDELTAEERAERGSFVGCVAGALSFAEFGAELRAAGLTDVEIEPTHAVAEGMHSAIARARKAARTAARKVAR